MGYIKDYQHDIFISYSHLDNQKSFNQSSGWIEQFSINLNEIISQRIGELNAVKIWWDQRKLDGSILFDRSIAEGIAGSAIMISLVSPGYLRSEYCQKELDLFHKKAQQEAHGLMLGNRSRILNVLLYNIPYARWPLELSGTSGFSFNDSKDKEDLGDPLDVGSSTFKTQLKELRNAIVKLIEEFRNDDQLPASSNNKKEEEKFTVYFGDVNDSLYSAKKRAITELEKKDYRIIYVDPPPTYERDHEEAVKEKLEKADLSVHLLNQYPGREIEDHEDIGYPQKETEICLQFAKSQLIWVPSEMDLAQIEPAPYKNFMEKLNTGKQSSERIEYIRGAKSTISQEIIDFVETLKSRRPTAKNGKVAVLLDTHLEDQRHAWELSVSLLDRQYQPLINPQEDEPRDNFNMLGERISQVKKLVFFYGKVQWAWVQRRLNSSLKMIVNNDYPVDKLIIFMFPPFKDQNELLLNHRFLKVHVIDNSDTEKLKEESVEEFFKILE